MTKLDQKVKLTFVKNSIKTVKFDIKNRDAEIFALQKGESSKIEVKCELFIILM